ncbi:hypothetical protein [Dehalobacter sp. DCA]|nr:hypothetical protein [Dehalobacter sp. DCA]
MRMQYPKLLRKKEPIPVKIKPTSPKPSAHRRVAFFRRCGKRKR